MQKRGKKSADSTLKLKKGPGNNSPSLSNVLRAYLFQRKRRRRQCRRHFGEGNDRQGYHPLFRLVNAAVSINFLTMCSFAPRISLPGDTSAPRDGLWKT